MPQCTAKSKRSGEQCKNHAIIGRKQCKFHGGKTPRGAASPNWKDGRYSRFMPTRYLETYASGIIDPAILDLSENVAAIDSRIDELLQNMDLGDARDRWLAVVSRSRAITKCLSGDDPDAFAASAIANDIIELAEAGASIHTAWDDIAEKFKLRAHLVDTESKRRQRDASVLSPDQVSLMVHQIHLIIVRHVTDRSIADAIGRELMGIVNSPTGEPAVPAAITDGARVRG